MAPTWLPAVLAMSVLKGTYGADSVTQTEGSVILSQGDPVLLNCTYQISGYPSLFWYVQYPNQPPRLFLGELGKEDSDEGIIEGFNATHDTKNKSFHLRKPSSDLSDSATYYCAGSDPSGSNWKLTFGKGTKLTVNPELPESPPSIYQLESPNEELEACLITDFFPGDIWVGNTRQKLKNISASLVQIESPEDHKTEASYGTVLWGPQDDFACVAKHENKVQEMEKSATEGDTCMTLELSDNFESDEKLNLLSFTMMGLRIIFVKAVAVNLLLTFCHWKN